MSKVFPIKDVQFHHEGLAAISPLDYDEGFTSVLGAESVANNEPDATGYTPDELDVLVAWHTTAIMYLEYGFRESGSGPMALREGPGGVTYEPIEDALILARDQHGQPFFKPIFKGQS